MWCHQQSSIAYLLGWFYPNSFCSEQLSSSTGWNRMQLCVWDSCVIQDFVLASCYRYFSNFSQSLSWCPPSIFGSDRNFSSQDARNPDSHSSQTDRSLVLPVWLPNTPSRLGLPHLWSSPLNFLWWQGDGILRVETCMDGSSEFLSCLEQLLSDPPRLALDQLQRRRRKSHCLLQTPSSLASCASASVHREAQTHATFSIAPDLYHWRRQGTWAVA